MKRAFSMVESVFVIAMIGILSAVALPKIFASRDDAYIVKALSSLNTIISDIGVYYVTKNSFASDPKIMSEVRDIKWSKGTSRSANFSIHEGELIVGKDAKRCIKLSIINENQITGKPTHIKIEDGSDIDAQICQKFIRQEGITKMKGLTFTYKQKENAPNYSFISTNQIQGEIALTGNLVIW